MEPEEPLQQGYLLLPPQGRFQQLKKSWHKKFCQVYKASKYGIQRLEIYDNQEDALNQHSPKIITLEACIKIAMSNQPLTFNVVTKAGGVHHFGCCSEAEMSIWISAFQAVAFKDETTSVFVEEDNDLYCTSGEGVFSIKIAETEASRKCNLEPTKNYTLIVGTTEMKLMEGSHVLYTWPYQFIRKYGYTDGKFTFEAGRRCGSGEGSFCLEHKNHINIYRTFVSRKEIMKQMLSCDNSPTVECSDAQFHAALSMEAGSRSPLPPSVNTSKSLIDMDISSFAQNTQKHLPSPISPTEPLKPPLPAKPKPAKPPRKPVFTSKLDKKPFETDNISDLSVPGKYIKLNSPTSPEVPKKPITVTDDEKHSYDFVEVRSDAWRTHGLDSVPHTERLKQTKPIKSEKDQEDPHYETMTFPSNPQNSVKSNSPSIIHNIPSPNDPPDYDRLQHFGSIYKNKKKPGYRAPASSTVSQNSQHSSQMSTDSGPSSRTYDIVEDLSAIRLADDSHHGYGIIRKKFSTSPTTNTLEPKHKIVNDSEYAVVSKPKRV